MKHIFLAVLFGFSFLSFVPQSRAEAPAPITREELTALIEKMHSGDLQTNPDALIALMKKHTHPQAKFRIGTTTEMEGMPTQKTDDTMNFPQMVQMAQMSYQMMKFNGTPKTSTKLESFKYDEKSGQAEVVYYSDADGVVSLTGMPDLMKLSGKQKCNDFFKRGADGTILTTLSGCLMKTKLIRQKSL